MGATDRTLFMKFSCTFFTNSQMIALGVDHIGFEVKTNLTQLLITQLLSRSRILPLITFVKLRKSIDIMLILVQHIIWVGYIRLWTPVIQTNKKLTGVPFLFVNQQMTALTYFIPKLICTVLAFDPCQLV